MIRYRTGEEGDAADISALISSFASELVDPEGGDAEAFLASVSTDAVRRHLNSPHKSFLLAHDDAKLIGVIAMGSRSHLVYFFVDHAHQRSGVGRKLWQLAKAQALAGGNPRGFTVSATMNAVAAYERLGFRACGPPLLVHGVRCVPMTTGEPRGTRTISTVLPREDSYPAMNRAADEIVEALGPAFTRTLDRHFPTAISAAACLAGAVLLREAESDSEKYPATQGKITDLQSRQTDLLIFMQIHGPAIDPGIERNIKPGAGLKSHGWGEDLSPVHSPLFDADTMVGKLQDLPEQVTQKHGITPIFRAHIPALAAMKLISSGHKSGLLDEKAGKALARHYMAAGCRTEPVQIRGK